MLEIPLSDLDPAFPETGAILPAAALVGSRDLPIYGSAEGGGGSMIVDYDPIDYVKRPAPLESVRGGYGILVTGESMEPVVYAGDILLINPHLPPRANKIAVFYRSYRGETLATVKTLVSWNDRVWKVRRYNPEKLDFTLDRAEWQHCHLRVGQYDGPR